MKTIIELYDKNSLLNVLAASVLNPENLVFLIDTDLCENERNIIKRFFAAKGQKINIDFIHEGLYDADSIERSLRKVISLYPDCAVEVTGGEELQLFAVGKLCAEMKKLPVFIYNRQKARFISVNAAEKLLEGQAPVDITIEQILLLSGSSLSRYGNIQPSEITAELMKDISNMWKIYVKYRYHWADFVSYLQAITREVQEGLDIKAPFGFRLKDRTVLFCNPDIMAALSSAGVIENFRIDKKRGHISFQYKSHLLRRLLCSTGSWLELYVYREALTSGYFDDVRTSIVIDWNADGNEDSKVINEIDVAMIKGIQPVFVSCKSGNVDKKDLNEIKLFSELIGGKAVLAVMSQLNRKDRKLYKRAVEMNITVVQESELLNGELKNILMGLVK